VLTVRPDERARSALQSDRLIGEVARDLRSVLGLAADGHESLGGFRYASHRMRLDRRAMTLGISRPDRANGRLFRRELASASP